LRFKALVQEGSDLISIFDQKGNYFYTSPTVTSILGFMPEDLYGCNVQEFIHPDDIEKVLAILDKVLTEDKVVLEPFRFKDNKGEWRWIETVLTNMLDNQAVNGIVANSRDVTESLNSRQQMEATTLFNNIILESSPDCLKILDKKGRLQYMNLNGLFQMEIDDFSSVKNKQWYILWGNENKQLIKDAIDKALTGVTAQFTAYCPTVKGKPKWWDVLVSPIGQPVEQIMAVSRDITSKKTEEQQLKLLESVITNTNESVIITEAEYDKKIGPKRLIYYMDLIRIKLNYLS
jgi:PAS domain S-box-containing protein